MEIKTQPFKMTVTPEFKLLLTFSAIARETDVTKLRTLIATLEQDYGQYVEVLKTMVSLPPESVREMVFIKYPMVKAAPIKAEAWDSIITKIQEYLKEKENVVGNDKAVV
jgi:hypothetical protein